MPTRSTRSYTRKASTASASSAPTKSVSSQLNLNSTPKQASSPVSKKSSTQGKPQDEWCICRGPDDNTPMIKCESCKDWFHFACINLHERDAEEIQLYVCDVCHEKTGQSTVYEWEGPDAVEEYIGHGPAALAIGADGVSSIGDVQVMKLESVDPSIKNDMVDEEDDEPEDEASGDDYKEEEHDSVVVRRGRGTKRITSSDEGEVFDDDDDGDGPPSRRAPSRRVQLKRKRGKEAQVVKRKRLRKPSSEVGTDNDRDQDESQENKHNDKSKTKHDSVLDPTRKYCLGKLREVLLPIFVQFATLDDECDDGVALISEFDEGPKNKAEEQGGLYVQELEQCLFEIYGEPDKYGHKTAAGKYKDRFRMLSFNLSQPDRYLLRLMIGTHALPALQLSQMSSVDLANEQTKQQIEAANRESLEHSILTQRPIAARAKITHKGEEIIEDLVGDDLGRRLRDEEQRDSEREREREKGVRDRTKMLPPPPPTLKEPTFKGPQDILAQQHSAASQKAAQIQAQAHHATALAISPMMDVVSEPSFKFDDLIAIDLPDEISPQDSTFDHSDTKAATSDSPPGHIQQDELMPSAEDSPTSPTSARSASFDLNHVWSGASSEPPQETSGSPIVATRGDGARDLPNIDIDMGTVADDEDFDMFLDQPDTTAAPPLPTGPEADRAEFEALPIVWSGNINLPDTGKCPAVHARQVGGRHIENASAQWHILFPQKSPHQLKVDGRVPVKDSARYMTQNRMNITRELIVVALTPIANRAEFDDAITFLINRDRHAVVHPWGPNPGPEAPGKELYLIPILPHEPLPDYVEILDLVKFPKQREDKMLLGVFILNRGKFSERLPSVAHQSSAPIGVYPFHTMPPAPAVPAPSNGPHSSNPVPLISPTAPQPIPPEIVSKLSAEQIESLLQTVLSGGLNALPATQPAMTQPAIQPQPVGLPTSTKYPSAFPSLANLLPQPYSNIPYSPYASTGAQGPSPYPPPPSHPPPPIPYGFPPQLPTSPPRDDHFRPIPTYGSGYGRTGRGDFPPRGGRNSGPSDRGRGARTGNDFDRTRDSGWAGRGRGRGGSGGGHQPSQSPPRPW